MFLLLPICFFEVVSFPTLLQSKFFLSVISCFCISTSISFNVPASIEFWLTFFLFFLKLLCCHNLLQPCDWFHQASLLSFVYSSTNIDFNTSIFKELFHFIQFHIKLRLLHIKSNIAFINNYASESYST